MKFVTGLAAVFLAGIFASSAAEAACTLGDLRGTWYAEGLGGDIAGHCVLVFDGNGALVAGEAGSNCKYEDHINVDFVSVTLRASGKLALTDTQGCGFAGNLSVGSGKLSTSKLVVRMSANKDVLTASGPVIAVSQGYFSKGHTSVAFTAVKKKP